MTIVLSAIFSIIFPLGHLQTQPLRKIENHAFRIGESLTFSIGWEFINAGTAILAVESESLYRDRPCFLITATTKSNSFFSSLYPVDDRLESYFDKEGLYPLKYVKKTSEGGTKRSFTVDFFHDQKRAIIDDVDSGKYEISIPEFLQDIISSFYYLRNQPMQIGQEIILATFDNGRYKYSSVTVFKREKIRVAAGEFDCIVVKTPIGPFNNKSDLNIWLTDDIRKIPVLMKSKIAIGSVSVELQAMTGVD